MARSILCSLLFFLGVLSSINAQNGVISGTVWDKDHISLPGATLKLDKYNRYTISDQNGYFEFLNVPEDDYIVNVTYIGYKPSDEKTSVKKGKNTVVNFTIQEASIQGQEVIIMGEMLKGQAKALNKQKTNSNISNIISSDQVGRFPDSNIGDALKRVPGITMQNDQGEARNIIIRGLAPALNSVTLNGNRIPSAEGDNRNVQMDLVPAEMISSVEVSKTLTSDMDADAIGGSVDLVTRATPNKQRISATLSAGYNPIREGSTYSGSFIYGNRFLGNKLGFVMSASLLNKDYGSDNIEAEWDKGKKDQTYIKNFEIRKYDVQRIRRSISTALDYKINENHNISGDFIYNWRDDRENRFRARTKIKPDYDANEEITGYKGEVIKQTKGGIDNDRNKNRRLEDQRVINYALKGQHLVSEKLDLDWNLSYSKASEDRPNERYISFVQKKVPLTMDMKNEKYPQMKMTGEDHALMKLDELTENHNYTQEDEYSAKVNARIPLSFIKDQKGRLRFGLKGRFKNKERDNIFYAYTPKVGNEIGVLSTVPTATWDGEKFQPGSQYAPGTFATNDYLGKLDLDNSGKFDKLLQPLEFAAANYTANEQVTAAYIRFDQNLSSKALLIVGLRAEHTYIKYKGNTLVDDNNTIVTKEESNSYLNILPSLTLKYNVQDNFVLRSAFTTALARPNYYYLIPYAEIITEDEEISVGNPNLKATYSYNFDVMGEYYFKSVGLVSGGLFYKNLKNFIYRHKNSNYTTADFANDFSGMTNPINEGDKWELRKYQNGENVDVFGFETAFQRKLDFLPSPFLKNFGIYLNYTYTWSKALGITNDNGDERADMKLPGTAPHMFNGSLSWENTKFSTRVSLNFASDYIDEIGQSDFYDRYYDKQMFLDANASYKFTKNFRIFGEANNLTNQPLRYYQGEKDRVMQLEYYRATFNFGLKYDF